VILDQAAEGWSLTQALEHLLAVEVTATDARRFLWAGSWFANLLTGATLDVTSTRRRVRHRPVPAG
jgi:hypothetical protein